MSPTTRTYTRAELDALDLPGAWADDAPEILHREQVETRRWVSVNELIFRAPDDGKPYRVHYEEGLTEVQEDHDPWNYDDTVTATLMEQHETTVTQWREVVEPSHEGPDPTPGGLATHRGTREQCTGPDCGPTKDDAICGDVNDDEVCDRDPGHQGDHCANATVGWPAHLSDSVRQFLTFALNCAAEEMDDRCDEFDDDDEAALETLRRIATGAPAEEQQTWTLTRAHLDPFLRGLVSELDYDMHKSWERNEETGEDDYPTLVDQVADMLDAVTASEEQGR